MTDLRRRGAVQPQEHRLRLEARRQLHLQRAVLHPARPGLGAVTREPALSPRWPRRSRRIELGGADDDVRVAGLEPLRARAAPPAAQPHRDGLARRLPADRGRLPRRADLRARHRAHRPVHRRTSTARRSSTARPCPCCSGRGALGIGKTPIGPTWDFRHYFLGADEQGRDVMARLLYGGRNSLLIGIVSALICCILATIVAVLRGVLRRHRRTASCRACSTWSGPFPSTCSRSRSRSSRSRTGSTSASSRSRASSLWLPIGIIAIIYIPYVARPIRGQVLSVREKEYVEAAIAQGASDWRLMRRRDPAQRDHDRDRLLPADDRDDDADRGGAVVPLDRRAAARRELGHDHQRRPGPALHAALGRRSPRASRSCSSCSR